ncbi:MAG: hypothetical protein ABI273_14460 [Lacunisphaera sp.]
MKAFLSFITFLTIAASTVAGTKPRFVLSSGDSGGSLVWRSHTFDLDGDRLVPKKDYIVEDQKAGAFSVCLEWKTAPDPSDGTFLDAFGSWRIPTKTLKEAVLVLTSVRRSPDSIVFTLSTPQGTLLMQSDAFPLSKGWRGDMKDIGKHVSPVPAATLEREPNRVAAKKTGSGR